jgi:hypothetical protein
VVLGVLTAVWGVLVAGLGDPVRFAVLGVGFIVLGWVTPFVPVLGRMGRALDREPGGVRRFQEARRRGAAFVGLSVVFGSALGVLLILVFP